MADRRDRIGNAAEQIPAAVIEQTPAAVVDRTPETAAGQEIAGAWRQGQRGEPAQVQAPALRLESRCELARASAQQGPQVPSEPARLQVQRRVRQRLARQLPG
jgi:hypothetical protein